MTDTETVIDYENLSDEDMVALEKKMEEDDKAAKATAFLLPDFKISLSIKPSCSNTYFHISDIGYLFGLKELAGIFKKVLDDTKMFLLRRNRTLEKLREVAAPLSVIDSHNKLIIKTKVKISRMEEVSKRME